jgi:hypothetical protein
MDFNGDGTTNDLLPGTRVNQFGRGLTREDLIRLVANYNTSYAGKVTAGGQIAPSVTLSLIRSASAETSPRQLRLARQEPASVRRSVPAGRERHNSACASDSDPSR